MRFLRNKTGLISVFVDAVLTGAACVSVVFLWICAASPLVHPATSRLAGLAGLAGLAFPLALFGTIAAFLLCVLFAPRRSWICLVGFVGALDAILSYIPLTPITLDDKGRTFCVINYNAFGFSLCTDDALRLAVLDDLSQRHPDIICLQEGSSNFDKWRKMSPDFCKLLPYYSNPYPQKGTIQGCCSRFPIVGTELITSYHGNAVIAFDIKVPTGDTVTVVNCHLKSNQLTPTDREQYSDMVHHPNQSTRQTDSTYHTSRMLAGKLVEGARVRAQMTDTLVQYLERHRDRAMIICGDFNDTPISYPCYKMRRMGYTDAYRSKGTGMGRSFNRDAIAVRIDHQFCTDHFKPVEAKIDKYCDWSDHYPLIVRYKLKTPLIDGDEE